MANKTRIEFDTTEYERNHGHSPRGRGSWAFCDVEQYKGGRTNYLDYTFWTPSMTYGEAKKLAKAHFQAKGECSGMIVVCS